MKRSFKYYRGKHGRDYFLSENIELMKTVSFKLFKKPYHILNDKEAKKVLRTMRKRLR